MGSGMISLHAEQFKFLAHVKSKGDQFEIVVYVLIHNLEKTKLSLSLKNRTLGNRGLARQPCCMAGTMKIFCIGNKLFSHRKINLLFLPCNMAAVQNLYKSCNNTHEKITRF